MSRGSAGASWRGLFYAARYVVFADALMRQFCWLIKTFGTRSAHRLTEGTNAFRD